jgi:2-phospho-L-lactate guanylyltransferase
MKPFERAKSRLAPVLSPAERATLAETMFERTVRLLTARPEVAATLVVSSSDAVLHRAADLGASGLAESGEGGLNAALELAIENALRQGADAVLIVPADLPLLAAEDIAALLRGAGREQAVIVAADRHRRGTNALLLKPPGIVRPQFGPDSLSAHRRAAREIGISPIEMVSEGLALDIDEPEDLALLSAGERERLLSAAIERV